MTDSGKVQEWTGTPVTPAQEESAAPLRGRKKKAGSGKPAKPGKARTKAEKPADDTGNDGGRSSLYLQAKARPVGVIVAWSAVGVLALGSILGAASFFTPQKEAVVQEAAIAPKEQRAGAEAVGLVSAWLSATMSDSEALSQHLGDTNISVISREAVEARNLTTASIETAADGSLVVTVAGEVKSAAASPEDGQPGSVWVQRWWTVALSEQEDGFAVLGMPAPAPAPARSSAPSLAYQNAAGQELNAAVSDFLNAYATGVGDVSRYVSPGSGIVAISPAPYTSVKVRSVSTVDEAPLGAPKDSDEARALAVVDLVVGEVQQQSQYALTLTARGGQWEVSAVEPSPVLSQK